MRRTRSSLLSSSDFFTPNFAALILCVLIFSAVSFAATPDRITSPIMATETVKLSAGVPAQARSEFDQGEVDPSLKLSYITLLTTPSAAEQKALNTLLAQQQNPHSSYYHKWLTPEQFADRFGLSQNDIGKLSTWLQSQGFAIVRVARARNWIVFRGTAAQVEKTFQTEIHNFKVDGETHFANTTPAAIPAALSGVVTGFRGLNNFRPKSYAHHSQPAYSLPVSGGYEHFIAPGDVATMYDLNALYNLGFDGTGETLAVMGQTDVFLADLADYRSGFGLSAINCTTNSGGLITACNTSNFQYQLINTDPGSPSWGDLGEADIDLEWSGGTARGAQIIYVNAPDPNGAGVWDSWYYAVDNVVSPVITMSYGLCELYEVEGGGFASDEAELQLASTEGITFMNSSADQGAAICDYQANLAVNGYAVSFPASSPEVTGVGGTLIPYTEYTSTYWNTTNGTDGGSAKSYIPEQAWNDAEEFGVFCLANPTNGFCTGNGINSWSTAQTALGIWTSGGGVSNCVTVDGNGVCKGGYPQPSWQSGLNATDINPNGFGVTTSPARFSPDVSLMSSIYWPGYLLCTPVEELEGGTDTASSCSPGGAQGIINDQTDYGYSWGGTSVASPIFAGIVAILNQYVNGAASPGLGNINPTLYNLAATPGLFNPVTTPSSGAYSDGAYCQPGTPTSGVSGDPWPAALQCPSSGPNAGFLGFNDYDVDPTTNYNLVTGLGSVDGAKLAAAFTATFSSTSTTLTSSAPNGANQGAPVTFTATVTTSGSNTPTGNVIFYSGNSSIGTGTLAALNATQATTTVTTSSLSVGTDSITAQYGGDSNNAASTSTVLSQVINGTFTFTSDGSTHTVLAGQQTNTSSPYQFIATPISGGGIFGAAVTFGCTFAPTDPTLTNSSCVFTPASIAVGAGATPVTMTITTKGPNPGVGTQIRRRRADNRSPWLPMTLPLAGIVVAGFAGRKVWKHSAVASLCVSLVLLGVLVACGGSSSQPIVVGVNQGTALYPNYATDSWPNQTEQFTATLTNTNNQNVAWTLSSSSSCSGTPSPCGTISSTGLYTAPTIAPGLPSGITVTATSQADPTKVGSTTFNLNPTTVPNAVTVPPTSGYTVMVTATEGTGTTAVTATPNVTLVVN